MFLFLLGKVSYSNRKCFYSQWKAIPIFLGYLPNPTFPLPLVSNYYSIFPKGIFSTFPVGNATQPYCRVFPNPTWKYFPCTFRNISHSIGKCFQSLLQNISHSHWNHFPYLLGNCSHPYWEMFFPISTGYILSIPFFFLK